MVPILIQVGVDAVHKQPAGRCNLNGVMRGRVGETEVPSLKGNQDVRCVCTGDANLAKSVPSGAGLTQWDRARQAGMKNAGRKERISSSSTAKGPMKGTRVFHGGPFESRDPCLEGPARLSVRRCRWVRTS